MFLGRPSEKKDTEGKYYGGEDQVPPGRRTDKGKMGHNKDMVPTGQGAPTTFH